MNHCIRGCRRAKKPGWGGVCEHAHTNSQPLPFIAVRACVRASFSACSSRSNSWARLFRGASPAAVELLAVGTTSMGSWGLSSWQQNKLLVHALLGAVQLA
eukprot:1141970-Pelagomonas_calceolata.AAC.1